MPFKTKEKAEKNGSKKTGSMLKTMFERYNPDKVTIDGLKNLKRAEEVAKLRDKTVEELLG